MKQWWLQWGKHDARTADVLGCDARLSSVFRCGPLSIYAEDPSLLIVTGVHASRCLVLIGEVRTDAGHLVSLLSRNPDPGAAMDAAHRLPGSFHVIFSDSDRLWIQGTASGLREVFYLPSRMAGLFFAGDAPSTLAQLARSEPDMDMLAATLMYPGLDYGLAEHSYWRGVKRLSAHQRLAVDDRSVRVIDWWEPDLDQLSIEDGAPYLAEVLQASLSTRANSETPLSADLSGGMDSTSLCLVLASLDIDFRAFVEKTADPNHDDFKWATTAAQDMGRSLHTLEPEDLPRPYDGISDEHGNLLHKGAPELNAPYTLIRNRARKEAYARLLSHSGETTHIAGFGGDELFTVAPSYLADLFGRSPWKALSEARRYGFLRRWSSSALLRDLLRREDYLAWLNRELHSLREPFARNAPTINWGPQLRLPPWGTKSAGERIRELVTRDGKDPRSQADARAMHTALAGQRIGGVRLAPLRRLMSRHGVHLSLPYMDDHVVEAALKVRRSESAPGGRYKPLLVESVRSITESPVLARATKGEFGKSVHAGIERNRTALLSLFKDSLLVEAGLIDGNRVSASIRNSFRPQHETGSLELTIAAEVWLREISWSAGGTDSVRLWGTTETGVK